MRGGWICAVLLLVAGGALSAPSNWHDDPDHSRLDWTAHWRETPVKGEFKRFDVSARLDPDAPAGGALTVRVDTASAAAASSDITEAVRGKAWFDAAQYPQAVFSTDSVTSQGDGSLLAKGTLKLKGHEKNLAFPLKLERRDGHLILTGTLRMDRRDFAIGTGLWAGASPIATQVTVDFTVTLVAGK